MNALLRPERTQSGSWRDSATIALSPFVRSLGWITLFLFALLALTGVLLSAYYIPSTAPAHTSDGREHGAALVARDVTWLNSHYAAGDIVAVPLSTTDDSIDIPPTLAGSVSAIVDSASGRVLRPSAAWTSTEVTITRAADLGAIIRSIHHYAASLFIAALVTLLCGLVVRLSTGARASFEWNANASLLLLALAAVFTGSVLPWNVIGYAAVRVATSLIHESVPFIGGAISSVARGGDDVGQATLTRAHALHTVVLPLAMVILVMYLARRYRQKEITARVEHSAAARTALSILLVLAGVLMVVGVMVNGSASPDSALAAFGLVLLPVAFSVRMAWMVAPERDKHDRYSVASPAGHRDDDDTVLTTRTSRRLVNVYTDLLGCLVLFGVIATFAVTSPWRVAAPNNNPIDLMSSVRVPDGAHPEWYAMPMYAAVEALPAPVALTVIILIAMLLFALPRFFLRK